MAFSAVLTGTAQSVNAVNGSNILSVTATTGWEIGATIQGTGIPSGAKVGNIVTNTSVTLVTSTGAAANYTGATGAVSVIVSSKYGSLLTVSQSAGSDSHTPLDIYNAGFGVLQSNIAKREIFFPGGLTVKWANIVSGAVFDFGGWSLEFGVGGRWLFQESSILGELRGGYLVNGTQFIKTAGPTFYCNSWNNGSPGGSSMFENVSGTTNQGTFRMHNMRVVQIAGSNTSPVFSSARMTMIVENLILDYQTDSAGANAGIGAAFGTLKNTYIVKSNAGIGSTNGTNYAVFDGITYVGNYQSSPNHKFSLPDNYKLDSYAPQVLSTQFLGGFNNATMETYSNINLTSAGWGLTDLKTKYLRYGGPITLFFPRTVSVTFKDSNAQNLSDVTLFISSGSTSLVNAVQPSSSFSNTVQSLNLTWNSGVLSYRVADVITDTISQTLQIRKYGYQQQSVSYSLNTDRYSQPFFMVVDSSLNSISESTAASLAKIGINWTTKVITVTANASFDEINARIAYELALPINSAKLDPRSINGKDLTLSTGWSLVINAGIELSEGTSITYLYCPTITNNGSITGIYGTTTGISSILQFIDLPNTAAACVWDDATGVTDLFVLNDTGSNKSYNIYFPPGSAGLIKNVAREYYGYQRESESITLVPGKMWVTYTNTVDVGITNTDKSAVEAYTLLETPSKDYDYTALKRLEQSYIKFGQIVTRAGSTLEHGTFNKVIKNGATNVWDLTNNVITIKASSYEADTKYNKLSASPPATITAFSTEIVSIDIEDANGDSSVTLNGTVNDLVDVYKITNSTPIYDYLTGTKIASNISSGKFRFTGTSGFKLVFMDKDTNLYRSCSMSKGSYVLGWYIYDMSTGGLTQGQSADFVNLVQKMNAVHGSVSSLTAGFVESTDSLHAISTSIANVPTAEENSDAVKQALPEVKLIPGLV